jgi:predicted nucleic acid-binding protein
VTLVDTSVWIDHLRRSDEVLINLLGRRQVVVHPFIIGELAVGNLRPREAILQELQKLRRVIIADDNEVLRLVEHEHLFGLGLGYIDVHLLASTRLTPETLLWTRDKSLLAAAERLTLAARVTH